ncbi:MAG TPA: phosphoribosylanthranilate isomerase [Blastocatellia bacterium]|nr:phosphoribosylanthranilate isomerase [Blastocatellia bacterium]
MSRVRVKICGIRSDEEASAAFELGADALGFNFWPGSPRYLSPGTASRIISRLSPFVACVGVFVNEDRAIVNEIAGELRLSAVQLHGDEPPDYCKAITSARVIKALRVGPGFDPAMVRHYPATAILLDARVPGQYGGTGTSFEWESAVAAKEFAPIILAGGIREENVRDAIVRVSPMAVDVCSGVESEPGRKDLRKLERFMSAVQSAALEFDTASTIAGRDRE